jgi:hypothetical protein
MGDPNADPTPEQLAEWWTADLASALEWAEGRLVRAKQLGDVEIRQHLGNLVKAARTLSTARAEVAALTAENERLRAIEARAIEAAGRLRDDVETNPTAHGYFLAADYILGDATLARKDPDQ